MFVLHDVNETTVSITSANGCLDYESCKVKNLQRPWSYYRKMQRNIPINTSLTQAQNINNRCYILCLYATPTQCIYLWWASPAWTDSPKNLGNLVITYYLVCKARN